MCKNHDQNNKHDNFEKEVHTSEKRSSEQESAAESQKAVDNGQKRDGGCCQNKEADAQELETCKEEVATWKQKFLLVSADLNNFTRRVEKEKIHWMQAGQADLLKKILPIVDDFDRALQEHSKQDDAVKNLDSWLAGFELIGKELYKFLDKAGVKEIDCNQSFNPELHEALMNVASEKHTSGEIVSVLQKGFIFNDQVIQPAKVTVAQ